MKLSTKWKKYRSQGGCITTCTLTLGGGKDMLVEEHDEGWAWELYYPNGMVVYPSFEVYQPGFTTSYSACRSAENFIRSLQGVL